MIVNGLDILSEDVDFFQNGSLHEAVISRDTLVREIPCLGNREVVFFPSGKLKLCWLSKNTTLNGIPCLGRSIIYFHENGQLLNASLACNHQIEETFYPCDSRLTFDEVGKLLEYSQQFNDDQTINGFPCSSQFVVWRYANGKPSVIVLSSPVIIDGLEYSRGTRIFLNKNGEVFKWQRVDLDSGKRYKQRIFGAIEADWQ